MAARRNSLGAHLRWSLRALAVALLLLLPIAAGTPAAQAQADRIPVHLTAMAFATTVGGGVYDTATISGGNSPTGTITFLLYGPADDTCSRAPIFTSVKPVMGAGTDPVTVTSDNTVLPANGLYHFVASYSGDAVHAPAGPTACADPAQAVGVGNFSSSLVAEASPATTVGGSVSDTATITTSQEPTGTMTFRLFGPDDLDCTGAPTFTSVVPVHGNGTYRSESFTPSRPGAYRWVASYSGDADDAAAVTSCLDPMQRVDVGPAPPGPFGLCASLSQQRAGVDGRLRALQQGLAPLLDTTTGRLVAEAVSWADAQLDLPRLQFGCA